MQKLKIGFFGGCFNPPTNIHIDLANNLIEKGMLDKVIFVPVGDYYPKQTLISAKDRYNMLVLACKNHKNIQVESIASSHKEKLYAIDTINMINEKYGQENEIYLIMGSDNFARMPNWKNYDELISNNKFIVIERPNHISKKRLANVIYYKTEQEEDISSTVIRNKIKRGEDTSKYLNKNVYDYILKNNLYN